MTIELKKIVFTIKTKILHPNVFSSYIHQEKEFIAYKKTNSNFYKRQQIVHYANENSPFYNKKYKESKIPFSIKTEEDFINLPVLSRNELAQNFEHIKVKNIRPWQTRKVTSSGSTSDPISVLHDLRHPSTSLRWRILKWWDIEPFENQAFVYRYRRHWTTRFIDQLFWWPTKRVFLPGAEMNLRNVKKFVVKINRYKPVLLQGYVDVIFEFALFILDYDLKIYPPKMVWVTSAPLMANQRKIMEKAFGAPVCDQYGNTEVLLIAAECPHQNGLHMLQDAVHIEFVDDNNQPIPANTTGKILITDLRNFAFPIIRYDIGDRGSFSNTPCGCTIQLPVMHNVMGRQSTSLHMPSGLTIKAENLCLLVEKNIKEIREIQLVQHQDYSVEIHYVSNKSLDVSNEIKNIIALLNEKTRQEILVKAISVDAIKVNKNKKPLVISLIP